LELPVALTAVGDRLLHFTTIDSTMDEARRQAAHPHHGRLWIVADEQTGGRGRQGRHWTSPPGNLYLTLLLPAPCPLRDQPKLGFVAGVALARAVELLLPTPSSVKLKWPNDLLLNGAKASGLLLEGLEQGRAVAIGIGVNITAHPDDTPYEATSLGAFAPEITAAILFASLATRLVEELEHFADGSGFPLTRQRWLASAAHLNQHVTVRAGEKVFSGLFKDIDADGRLLLETPSGLMRIDAGDVFPLDKEGIASHEQDHGFLND
jgi:BirA family transcriptional regulator, biotin operon repressor / biotin---[acetyl-CoA-carboxylase] ligase